MEGDAPKPIVDAFGDQREADTGKLVTPPAPASEKKPEVGADGKPKVEEKAKTDDLEQNPLVVELRTSIKTLTEQVGKEQGDKKSMGENLSAMRKRLDKIEKGDKTDAAEPLFKKEEIKRVKDYTKEEQEDMSPALKEQIESNADMKERMNSMIADAAKKAADAEAAAGEKTAEEQATEDINTHISEVVQPIALKLAQDDKDLANEIIKNFNLFAGNDTADDKELAARMEKAALMTPKFKPAKEQASGQGGRPVAEGNAKDDPHGVSAIIDEAKKGKGGQSFTL